MCVHIPVCVHVCVCMWRPKADAGCLLWCFSTLLTEVRSLTEPEACQFWLVRLASGLRILTSDKQMLGLQAAACSQEDSPTFT